MLLTTNKQDAKTPTNKANATPATRWGSGEGGEWVRRTRRSCAEPVASWALPGRPRLARPSLLQSKCGAHIARSEFDVSIAFQGPLLPCLRRKKDPRRSPGPNIPGMR